MKTMRNLFLLCAGLSLFACSSDDDATQQLPEGTGAVTVKIANPSSRGVYEGSSVNQTVNGNITLTLEHGSDKSSVATLTYADDSYTDSGDGTYADLGDVTNTADNLKYTFYGIETPKSITASMYGGVNSYDDILITSNNPDMQADPDEIPVYGEQIGGFSSGQDIIVDDVTYRQYTASFSMTIPVARLEVNVEVGDMSSFGSVELLGAYLDDVKPTADDAAVNYYLKGDDPENSTADADNTGDGAFAILADSYLNDDGTYNSTKSLKLTGDGALSYLPSQNSCFAYNFYPGTNPKFKLLLKVSNKAGQADIPEYQYAILSFNENLEAQNIYKANVVLNAENIQIDEEGADIQYALTATVTKAKWTAISVEGSWGQGTTEQQ